MKYVSTRDKNAVGVESAYAIKSGLAKDGGLYMPERIPRISYEEIIDLIKMSYSERAAAVLSRFLTDYTKEELSEDANSAYS